MPHKSREERARLAEATKRWREANPDKWRAARKNTKNRLKDLVKEMKEGQPCARCDQHFPFYCLEFHHRDPDTKLDSITSMLRRGVSYETLKAELQKCDVLCACCHRILEAQESDGPNLDD